MRTVRKVASAFELVLQVHHIRSADHRFKHVCCWIIDCCPVQLVQHAVQVVLVADAFTIFSLNTTDQWSGPCNDPRRAQNAFRPSAMNSISCTQRKEIIVCALEVVQLQHFFFVIALSPTAVSTCPSSNFRGICFGCSDSTR